ncbi:hypothetical protein OA343_02920 [Paracoccaceae bacterium]|nr:hypothetical protein [Paracoccaceae bacterium]
MSRITFLVIGLILFPTFIFAHNPSVETEVDEIEGITKQLCPIKSNKTRPSISYQALNGKGLSCPNLPLMFIENGHVVNFSYLPIIYKGKLTEGTPFSPYLDLGYTIDWTKTLESKEPELLSLSIKYNWSHKKCAYKNEAKIQCVLFNDIVSFEEEKKKIIERIIERSLILSD